MNGGAAPGDAAANAPTGPGAAVPVDGIDTPAVLIDLGVARRNVERYQGYCDGHGLALRPHVKTHKLPRLARMQLDAGAVGIVAQKVSEAEVMVDAGIDDVLITYNVLGPAKLSRLRALAGRTARLAVVADNAATVDGLSGAFADAPRPLPVLVECDTGAGRCGVQAPADALALARRIDAVPGLSFAGLMTYPPTGGGAVVAAFVAGTRTLLDGAGLACPIVSSGGSPDMWRAHEVPGVTEVRIGTYVYNDRSLVERGTCALEDCALHVLATIVSVPAPGRAVIDAGSKALTSDLFGLEGHGRVIGHDVVRVESLSEEHGVLRWDDDSTPFAVGDRVRVLPNHACPVSNLFDAVWLVEGGGEDGAGSGATARREVVAARGAVT